MVQTSPTISQSNQQQFLDSLILYTVQCVELGQLYLSWHIFAISVHDQFRCSSHCPSVITHCSLYILGCYHYTACLIVLPRSIKALFSQSLESYHLAYCYLWHITIFVIQKTVVFAKTNDSSYLLCTVCAAASEQRSQQYLGVCASRPLAE